MTPAANDRDEARYEKRRAESRPALDVHPDDCDCKPCAVDEWDGQP